MPFKRKGRVVNTQEDVDVFLPVEVQATPTSKLPVRSCSVAGSKITLKKVCVEQLRTFCGARRRDLISVNKEDGDEEVDGEPEEQESEEEESEEEEGGEEESEEEEGEEEEGEEEEECDEEEEREEVGGDAEGEESRDDEVGGDAGGGYFDANTKVSPVQSPQGPVSRRLRQRTRA